MIVTICWGVFLTSEQISTESPAQEGARRHPKRPKDARRQAGYLLQGGLFSRWIQLSQLIDNG